MKTDEEEIKDEIKWRQHLIDDNKQKIRILLAALTHLQEVKK